MNCVEKGLVGADLAYRLISVLLKARLRYRIRILNYFTEENIPRFDY